MNEPQASEPPKPKRRRTGCLLWIIAVPLLVLGWCRYTPLNRFSKAALQALRSDPDAIFYSIDPGPPGPASQGFRGYEIVGQTRLASQHDRDVIVHFINSATHGAFNRPACFNPRHAFRAHGAGGTYDFLLCFECGQAIVHYPDGQTESVLITGTEDFLDNYLRSHAIPLPLN